MAHHLTVAGLVQGVGYRQWLRRRAEARGLAGWVRNRADGTVEALLDGPDAAVEALAGEAMSGPLGAKVDRIDRRPATAQEAALSAGPGFAILPTA